MKGMRAEEDIKDRKRNCYSQRKESYRIGAARTSQIGNEESSGFALPILKVLLLLKTLSIPKPVKSFLNRIMKSLPAKLQQIIDEGVESFSVFLP